MSRDTELGLGDTYGQLDEAATVCECGAIEDFDTEFCAAGQCVECCDEQGDCHVICVKCKRRVSVEDVCSCCGRCDLHDCKQEEDDARREDAHDEARGDLIAACREWRAKRESAVGGEA